METKFKYGDKVEVIKGFYTGLVGKVIDFTLVCSPVMGPDKWYYLVRFNEPDPHQKEFFERSFSDEEYIQRV